MFIYVGCWPLLAMLGGELIPAIGNGDLSKVIEITFKALIIFFIQKIAQFLQDILFAQPALMISQDLRKDIFSKLQRIELNSIQKISAGDITYRLTEDADRVGEVIFKTIQDTTPCILQLLAVFLYMLYLDWQLSLATIILAPIVSILVSQFGTRVMNAAEKSQIQVSELASLLGEAINGISIVRAFSAEKWLQERFNHEVNKHRKAKYKTLKLLAMQHPVVGFIEASGILTVLAIGAYRIQNGALDSQGFSSYVTALLMLIDPISHLTINFNELKQGQASLRRLKKVEQEPYETPDNDTDISLEHPIGSIEFKDIFFSYENKNIVLNGINLSIKPGKVVALVGPSGAGKSTLISTLLRFNNLESGSILFDGININNIKRHSLRRQIALVPQKPIIFSGSIFTAINFGRSYTEDEIIKAAKIANAHDFIKLMPDGYKSKLEEKGSNISGGQLQRIAIARAVIGNPAVLLLDEATSALDAESEESIQGALKQAMKGRTVIVIAHRLATVQEADEIVFIDKGKIIEKGSHSELMRRKSRYRELCEKQFIKQ